MPSYASVSVNVISSLLFCSSGVRILLLNDGLILFLAVCCPVGTLFTLFPKYHCCRLLPFLAMLACILLNFLIYFHLRCDCMTFGGGTLTLKVVPLHPCENCNM
jgi:hypothetical protein